MRAAPPVDAALGGGRLERMLMVLLHALAGGVCAAWLGLHAGWQRPGWWLATLGVAAALGVLGAVLARRVLPATPGRLRWTGAQWALHMPGQELPLQRVVVAIDVGGWMLLRLQGQDRPFVVWRVAAARSARGGWHGLRVALVAHAGGVTERPAGEVHR
jgi:hypothetical protein